jgi:hypothetical protein
MQSSLRSTTAAAVNAGCGFGMSAVPGRRWFW